MLRNDAFALLETQMDGRRLLANIDLTLDGFPLKHDFPWFLSLSTTLRGADPDGLPTDSEAAALNHWEDEVERAIGAAVGFKYIGRVTWNGHRELLFQIAQPDAAVASLQRLIEAGTARPFAFRCQRDESWNHVSGYLAA